MPKRKNAGGVWELTPDVQRLSYKAHGVWVRHKKMGHVGRIAYYDRERKLLAVVWEPATKTESKWPSKIRSASLVPKGDLVKLKGYDPEPWYDFEELKRREKALDGE